GPPNCRAPQQADEHNRESQEDQPLLRPPLLAGRCGSLCRLSPLQIAKATQGRGLHLPIAARTIDHQARLAEFNFDLLSTLTGQQRLGRQLRRHTLDAHSTTNNSTFNHDGTYAHRPAGVRILSYSAGPELFKKG